MSKQRRQLTATKQGDRHGIQHAEEIDDNLLPDAAEIEKLHTLDPDILTWLKKRAEQEQNFRHTAHTNRMEMIERQNRREHNTGRMGLFLYFLLVAGCVTASYFLIRAGHSVQGSVLGGASVIFAFAIVLSKRPSKEAK
jgi:uncharacterized membrane protein